MNLETGASLKEVVDKMEQFDADLQNKKQLIATAVTGKDVPTNGSDSFQKMADNIDSIKTKLPILEGDVGVTEDSEGNVYGIKRISGRHTYDDINIVNEKYKMEWKFTGHTSAVKSVTVDMEGNVYTASADKTVKKLNSVSEIVWSFTGHTSDVNSVTVDMEGNVYTASADKTVRKISPQGNEVWSFTGLASAVSSVILGSDECIYLGSGETISKLSKDGVLLSSIDVLYLKSLAVDNKGYFYYGDSRSMVNKLSSKGELIWSTRVNNPDVRAVTSVSVDNYNGSVYSCCANSFTKLARDGFKLWNGDKQGYIESVLVDKDSYVYTGGSNPYSVRKLTQDNAEVWSFTEHTSTVYSLSVDKGHVYTCSNDKGVIKIKDNYILEKVAVLKERII